MSAPLIITRDESLLDELLRLAAAAGVTPEVAPDAVGGLAGWAGAPLVLVGADVAAELVELRPRRREGVHVVSLGGFADDVMATALALGAENVAQLPGSGEWVVEHLTDLGEERPRRAWTVAVVGGAGGAGATTFAAALGQVAARSDPTIVVDTDRLGPGLDRVLGMERLTGVRWDELCRTTGRLGAMALREGVPRRGPLGVLTFYARKQPPLPAFAVREVLSAAQRGHDTVVVDLPRVRDAVLDEVLVRCDRVLVVTRPTLSALASTERVVSGLPDPSRAALVVRGGGLDVEGISRVLPARVITRMGDQRGLAEAVDLGFGPVRSRRGPLARAAREVLDRAAPQERAA